MTTARLGRRMRATCCLVVLWLAATVLAATPARGALVAADPRIIDADATATLHITKYAGAPVSGTSSDGRQETVSGRTPLEGVTFRVTQVCLTQGGSDPVDLTTNAGWVEAREYGPDGGRDPANYLCANPAPVAGTTGSDGRLTFTGLPLGLYYVEETTAPSGYTKAAPFVVTLPMTDPVDENQWNYEVYVYPKNTQDIATKTVEDARTQTTDSATGPGADHEITYTIRTSITDGLDATAMGTYSITDALDPRLTFEGVTLAIDPDGDAGSAPLEPLVAGQDYTTTPTAPAADATVEVVLTSAGREKLAMANAANADATVVTTLRTTLGAAAATGLPTGVVPNRASFVPNQAWSDQNPGSAGIETNETRSTYGNLAITKVVAGSATTLAGARFAVYADGNNDEVCTDADVADAHLLVPETGPTRADDALTITGLQTSGYYNDDDQSDPLTYCLVETRAPDGHNLLAEPIAFTIDGAVDTDGNVVATTQTVPNEPSNLGNRFPATGAPGVIGFAVAGMLLLAAGLAVRHLNTRRAQSARSGAPSAEDHEPPPDDPA